MRKVFRGTIVSPVSLTSCDIIDDGYLTIAEDGTIESISEAHDGPYEDYSGHLIMPGLIDTHTHLPQFGICGIGESTLLEWLKNYTFPCEGRFAESSGLDPYISHFYDHLMACGTTTAVMYGTSHKDAVDLMFALAEHKGIRAYLGMVFMDRNAPDDLLFDVATARSNAEELIDRWHTPDGLLQYVSSPRFAISCTQEMLTMAGELAKAHNLVVQTHLSENTGEIDTVAALFPDAANYTDVYAQACLLTEKTLLGHGVHLSDDELQLIKKAGSTITHCPTSNRFLASGMMPLQSYLEKDISVSLGTDVAGGYSLSMFDEMKEAIETSKLASPKSIDWIAALYLATLGGAKALKAEDRIGSLEVGKDADVLIVDPVDCNPWSGLEGAYTDVEHQIVQCIYRRHPDMVAALFVKGKQIV